jgi:hypothetical protein
MGPVPDTKNAMIESRTEARGINLGLKNWLAKNVSGVSGYGTAMGREVVDSGLALGRFLYLGHGISLGDIDCRVFEDSEEMAAAGFAPYCKDPLDRPPMEDSSDLSTHLRAVGVTFAATCTFTAAFSFMKKENASSFTRSMGSRARIELEQLGSGITPDILKHYNNLPRPAGITGVLNSEKPGTNDLLSVLLAEAVNQSQIGAVCFQRAGVLGFEVIAVPLAEETVKMVSHTARQFSW